MFRKPLGLVLAGGGALGAWQAGFLDVLVRRGLAFDKVLGFSAGALTGSAYGFGWPADALERWRGIDRLRALRFSPRVRPFSLFSDAPVWAEATRFAQEETEARRLLRCELIVMSLCINDWMPVYSRFTPRGEGGWDGPLAARLVASCTIPWIFPPVRIGENGAARTYIDGGVPGRAWMRCDALAGCEDVIVLEMVRPEEVGRRRWLPLARYDQKGREVIRRQIDSGIESLRALPRPPRVFRLCPSRVLDFYQLSFRSRCCAPAVDLGAADAESFLQYPGRFVA